MVATFSGRNCLSYFSQVKKGLNVVSPRVFSDPDMTIVITWRVFQESIFDTEQRKNIETFIDYNLRVVKVMKEFDSTAPRALVPGAGGLIQGEIRFVAEQSKAPPNYSYRDLLIADNVTYAIDNYIEILHEYILIDVKGLG